MIIMMSDALTPVQARKLLSRILADEHGQVIFSRHAREEMAVDGLTVADVFGVLRAGRIFEPAELEKGSWRYRVHAAGSCVVITFAQATVTVVVTAWRK